MSKAAVQPPSSRQQISLLSQISLDPSVYHVFSPLQACGAPRLT
jgi:hypothetical protein